MHADRSQSVKSQTSDATLKKIVDRGDRETVFEIV